MKALDIVYKAALHTASSDLQSKLSSQFVSVSQEESEQKYLQSGHLPTDMNDCTCICCGHKYTDEPDSNRLSARSNAALRGQWERQIAEDEAIRSAGGQVLTTRGTVMAVGRQRPEPSYKPLTLKCHCKDSQCSTSEGPVPVHECPKRCIDDDTGERYGFDEVTGHCLCPICACTSCPSFYTVSSFLPMYFPTSTSS